jgi:hypothetical protein
MIGSRDVALMGELRNSYTIVVGKPEGKRLLARLESRCEDSIKIDIKETVCDDVVWINLIQSRV